MYINNDIEPTIAKLREHYKNDIRLSHILIFWRSLHHISRHWINKYIKL
jgi:hypothetical protein